MATGFYKLTVHPDESLNYRGQKSETNRLHTADVMLRHQAFGGYLFPVRTNTVKGRKLSAGESGSRIYDSRYRTSEDLGGKYMAHKHGGYSARAPYIQPKTGFFAPAVVMQNYVRGPIYKTVENDLFEKLFRDTHVLHHTRSNTHDWAKRHARYRRGFSPKGSKGEGFANLFPHPPSDTSFSPEDTLRRSF